MAGLFAAICLTVLPNRRLRSPKSEGQRSRAFHADAPSVYQSAARREGTEAATATELLDLTPLESEVLEEIWSLDLPFLVDNPLAFAVVVDPMSFFPAYCRLSSLYEKHGFRRFSAIPLRRSLIQSHIRIDTVILHQHILCITRQEAEAVAKVDLWLRVCNLQNKAFRSRHGMCFEGSITTDGTSMSACRAAENVIVIDPNKRDILYCQDSNGTTFRYTANQRCKETGSRRIAKRREAMKAGGIDLIESRIPSHKTMNLMDFTRYLLVRRADSDRRKEFYSHPL